MLNLLIIIYKAYKGPVYQDLIGYTYIKHDISSYLAKTPIADLQDIVGEIWNNLTIADSNRYVGGGWYSLSAQMAFICSITQIGGLDNEYRTSLTGSNRSNLDTSIFSNVSCNVIKL
jgi:hypothetical protein